jgi:hypothetical protein
MKLISLSFFIFLVACSNDNFRKVETLDTFRILGISSTDPEGAPLATSTLQLYVTDTKGGGRTIIGTYESCLDPGISLGAPVTCKYDPAATNGTYTINTGLDPDLGAGNLYTGFAGDTVLVTLPATIFLGRSSREQFNGVSYITIFKFNVDGKNITAFKRIIATTRVGANLNTNPSITTMNLNGAAIGAKPSKDDSLSLTTAAAESFNYQNVDGSSESRTEKLEAAWYVSKGEISMPKARANQSVKYKTNPPSSDLLILSILRDGRGGFDVVREIY